MSDELYRRLYEGAQRLNREVRELAERGEISIDELRAPKPDLVLIDDIEVAVMTPEQLMARVRENVARARAERAQDSTPRGMADTDPDSGSLSEDEERERSRGRRR